MEIDVRQKLVDCVPGINKERDYSIIEFHARFPEKTAAESISILGIDVSEARYSQILNGNQDLTLKVFALINPLWFKEGRAMECVKMYRRKIKGMPASFKDPIDILDCIRKEVEGNDKTSINIHNINANTNRPDDFTLTPPDKDFQRTIRHHIQSGGAK